ncbi:MAG: HD domain-containing protein [Bacteroidetes bacterium]|nr:HD domain-containing protein [Bacteroidota bacterium]
MKFDLVKKDKVLKATSAIADKQGIKAFVIGGWVRDLILKRPCKDIDIVCEGDGISLAQAVLQKINPSAKLTVFKNFGTAHFKHNDIDYEFVGARRESYNSDSRKPIVTDGTLDDDQRRRDFTINALGISLNKEDFGQLNDPFDGLAHLESGTLKTPLEPGITFSDDPLRMMRAVRFATQLSFNIEPETYTALKKNAHRLKIVSRERVIDELNKIILTPQPSKGFVILFNTGLLQEFFPQFCLLHGVEQKEGRGHKDNFYHTLEVLDNICESTDDLWLRWSAILHDIAKPATKKFEPVHGWTFHGHEDRGARMVPKIFAQLKLPLNEKMKFVQKMVLLHLRPIVLAQEIVTDSAVRRLLFDAGDDIDSLMKLCHADVTTKNEYKIKKYKQNFELVKQKLVEVEEKDRIRNWQPPIDGALIMKTFNLQPGREVGLIKTAIREAILDGEITNEFDAAYQLMIKTGAKLGLNAVTV